MSIDHLKKQAKNLHHLLPDFITHHPDGGKLSDSMELIAKTHGFPSLHAAQTKYSAAGGGKSISAASSLDEIELALAIGQMMGADAFDYIFRSGDQITDSDQVVFRLWSNDLHTFQFRDEGITGGDWDPADDPHLEPHRYEVAICFRGTDSTPAGKAVLSFAKRMFEHLSNSGGEYVFGYMAEGQIHQFA